MIAAYHLCSVPAYPQTRRTRDIPVILVPSDGEVTEGWRIVLRASIYKAFAIVNFDRVQSYSSRAPKPGVGTRYI